MNRPKFVSQLSANHRGVRHPNDHVIWNGLEDLQNGEVLDSQHFRALDLPVHDLIGSENDGGWVLEVIDLDEFCVVAGYLDHSINYSN